LFGWLLNVGGLQMKSAHALWTSTNFDHPQDPKTQTLVVNVDIFYVTNLFERALHLATLGNIIEQQLTILNQLMVRDGGLWNIILCAFVHLASIPIKDHNPGTIWNSCWIEVTMYFWRWWSCKRAN
jgi:hypothetical protein